jgi:predicted ATP-binding protein involved in virulence
MAINERKTGYFLSPYPSEDNYFIEHGIQKNDGIILIDEIEDGINPYLTEKVSKILQSIVKKLRRQIIVTTHSPIILDYISSKDITFLWKKEDGGIDCSKMFKTTRMKKLLTALNPGEVWTNLSKEQILERMGVK